MKKSLLSILPVLIVTTIGLSQEALPENCPLASVIQVDGVAEEWPMKWYEDPDKHFSYTICSDENNLYIRLKTSDDMVKRKIGHFGLTVWMDPNGKKKKKLGLRFPTGVEAKERIDKMKPPGDYQSMTSAERAEFQQEVNKALLGDLEILELLGLADDPLTSTRSGITNGLKVAIAADENGSYVYEALIPFKSFRLSKASISTLGIGFETGKYVPPPSKAPAGGAGGGGGGGYGGGGGGYGGGGYGGGYGGGGYGGGYGGGGGRQYQGSRGSSSPMASSTSMWVSLKLK